MLEQFHSELVTITHGRAMVNETRNDEARFARSIDGQASSATGEQTVNRDLLHSLEKFSIWRPADIRQIFWSFSAVLSASPAERSDTANSKQL